MATKKIQERFKNCVIDCTEGTITEISKDSYQVYSLKDLLERWSNIPDVTLTLSHNDDTPSITEEGGSD